MCIYEKEKFKSELVKVNSKIPSNIKWIILQ